MYMYKSQYVEFIGITYVCTLLGQFETGVRGNCIAQFLPQSALLLVVWQLQQVETRGRGG